MDGSYYFVVPKPSFWHLDAGGWEPSTASKADLVTDQLISKLSGSTDEDVMTRACPVWEPTRCLNKLHRLSRYKNTDSP